MIIFLTKILAVIADIHDAGYQYSQGQKMLRLVTPISALIHYVQFHI